MIKRYIFPVILIIIGIAGINMPEANFPFFNKLAQIVPQGIQFAPLYQMVYGLIAVIGFIGIVEVFITNRSRKEWRENMSGKPSTKASKDVNYYGSQNLPRGSSRRSRR